MNAVDLAIILLLATVIVLILLRGLKRRKSGENSCCRSCRGCSIQEFCEKSITKEDLRNRK